MHVPSTVSGRVGLGLALAGAALLAAVAFIPGNGPLVGSVAGGAALLVGGVALLLRRPSAAAPAPKPETFSHVLVVSDRNPSPEAEEQALVVVRDTVSAPLYPLAPNARVTTLHAGQLPEQTPAATEAFVWTLQQRYGKRGGPWKVDHRTSAGRPFMIIYLG